MRRPQRHTCDVALGLDARVRDALAVRDAHGLHDAAGRQRINKHPAAPRTLWLAAPGGAAGVRQRPRAVSHAGRTPGREAHRAPARRMHSEFRATRVPALTLQATRAQQGPHAARPPGAAPEAASAHGGRDVRVLQAVAQVRLVAAVALHRVCVGQPSEGPRQAHARHLPAWPSLSWPLWPCPASHRASRAGWRHAACALAGWRRASRSGALGQHRP